MKVKMQIVTFNGAVLTIRGRDGTQNYLGGGGGLTYELNVYRTVGTEVVKTRNIPAYIHTGTKSLRCPTAAKFNPI
jgi:hypothetical protein